MIVPKNRHLEVATAILGNKRHAKALLQSLEQRTLGSYQFYQESTHSSAAILLVHNPGNTTTCIATPPSSEEEIGCTTNAIRIGMQSIQNESNRIAQTIMDIDQPLLAMAYRGAGFIDLARLTYMERATLKVTQGSESSALTFSSIEEIGEEVLQNILQETYMHSLDCPNIHGKRRIEDIIEGHRHQGDYTPSLWSIASHRDKPVGVVLLSPLKESACMELSYLGVVPNERGKGFGGILLQHAIAQSKHFGLSRIVLAVDSTNEPAIQLYQRWSFRTTRQRLSMIHTLC